ncbi:HAD family hydrolase [Natranaerobius thermophilus]|uniref:Haloacid dehalogenase domain protein hydrolase n=1 Tax=Natranaerobius thermophilus (strain ATCC BAA-1301 / DSM 18059 / JW/NM-WN-LF) TaxID=457570 RepID=B2A6C7_NATTJ|nr:HAD family hydrolase [Natranaerobius thermophilus]ACB84138.1 Haloacid dehalogenase domain protein hydrolase [Natranaerobius thermophilus JW/NM-WN-LF]
MGKFTAILFDLDGTLLPVDTKVFIYKYFELMKKSVSNLYDPEVFVKHVWEGSKKMINSNDSKTTNQQVFFQYFNQAIDLPLEQIESFFDDFYNNKFPELRNCVGETEINRYELISSLKKAGYQVIIATNPIFPKEAIEHRLDWIGLSRSDFDLVTTYENMHFAKPNIRYYQEICSQLQLSSQECIMVGNDTGEDLIAKKLDMQTYLVTDYLIDERNLLEQMTPDYQGTLQEMSDYFNEQLVN